MKELATLARRSHDPAFAAMLDYIDSVHEQVESSAMRDGAAAALELLAQEIRKEAGCFSVVTGYRYTSYLKSKVEFYEELAKPEDHTIGGFADHAARHRGAAKAIETIRKDIDDTGLLTDFDPKRLARLLDQHAALYRTGAKRL